MNKKILALLAFVAGTTIGINWPKIKKFTAPYTKRVGEKIRDSCSSVAGFFQKKEEKIKKK